MITSIDFGCYSIRSARRSAGDRKRLQLIEERSEYVVVPPRDDSRQVLRDQKIPYAECEDALVAFGNRARDARWLSRKPCAPLFSEGKVPTDDPPARQILSMLAESLLPQSDGPSVCCFSTPGGRRASGNIEFLSRLIQMQGHVPLHCTSSTAAMLAGGSDTQFSGISVVCGAETCEICVCRHGLEVASDSIDMGSNWIDTELATQFQVQTWDDHGDCYLDLDAARSWKMQSGVHLRSTVSEREKTLARLYGVVLEKIAHSLRGLIQSPAVRSALGNERMTLLCSGGPTLIGGFTGALTERLVELDCASNLVAIKVAQDAQTAIVRGLLIQAELEVERTQSQAREAA